MIINTSTIEHLNPIDLDQVQSKDLIRKFGQTNDSIELTIFDGNESVLINDENFTNYTSYEDQKSIDIDFEQVLRNYGFNTGKYTLNFSFQRKVLTLGATRKFSILEISPSRTEIRYSSNELSIDNFKIKALDLVSLINRTSYFKDLNLSFSNGITSLITNAQVDGETGLIKLYKPLPPSITIGNSFRIYEDIINPINVLADLGASSTQDIGINLQGPNFEIEYNDELSVPSEFRTYDELLNNGSISSSFNNLQNYLSSSIPLDLEFDNPDTPSGYHFENFIHFSSATERLQNFKYKLSLLESYEASSNQLTSITGPASASAPTLENKRIFTEKTNQIIAGFDYYERYLYFESGAYAWPKSSNTGIYPHTNAVTTSPAAVAWFGAPINESENTFYGGMMLSASMFDDCNPYNLTKAIPPDIRDNTQNEGFNLFVEMIAQHFDGIWAYIDSLTDKYQAHSGINDGISKELVFNALAEKGIRAYSQFENSNIYEYFLGNDKGSSSFKYSTTDGSTMITSSLNSIPKGDISKEIWKRLYHNSPYLLKTKGTERGLKALIACYGIPETILHVKEYGGPLSDKTGFRTFSYQKESRMVNRIGNAEPGLDSIIRVISPFRPDNSLSPNNPTSLQVRYLPDPNHKTQSQPIFTIANQTTTTLPDLGVLISQSLDNSLINSESFAHLILVTGSSIVSDITQNKVITSELVPFFNGDVWNISLTLDSGSSNNIKAYATNTTPNKNTYVASCTLNAPEFFADVDFTGSQVFVQPEDNNLDFGANGSTQHTVTGSFQEFRFYKELLTEETIVTQSLSPFNYNGNSISSSYENLAVRIPLGSDLDTPGDSLGVTLDLSDNINKSPNPNLVPSGYTDSFFTINPGKYVFIEETHHLTTPDTVGSGMVSDKIRIDNGTFDDNFLDPFVSVETSPQDRQPLDYSDVGVFFSPTFEVNEDIIYTLGGFRLDDYIGDPTHYTSGSYPDLKTIKDIYFQKVNKKLGIGDYIRTIQFFDHTLFKMIKDFVPAKANLKTGLVIEPHYLERAKFGGTNIDYEQITEHPLNLKITASLTNSTHEIEHNVLIDVDKVIIQGSSATAVENTVLTGRKSRFYSII